MSEATYSHWTRRPDTPRWYCEIKFDGANEIAWSGHEEGAGLDVLDGVIRRIPDLIYRMPEEPHTVHIEISDLPF